MSTAAFQNLSPNWHQIFDKLGLNVILVQFDTQDASPIHSHPQVAEALGLELQQIGAGFFDSSYFPGCYDSKNTGSAWHFFHAHDLAAAMERLKSQLAFRGLLGCCNILHAEDWNRLVFYYSPDPEAIGKTLEG